jgi:hypothetical protein
MSSLTSRLPSVHVEIPEGNRKLPVQPVLMLSMMSESVYRLPFCFACLVGGRTCGCYETSVSFSDQRARNEEPPASIGAL